jgi:DNA repair protein RecN (Recombination protein N)
MLLELRLRDFVIVDHLTLGFSAGFTVLTGETGAGKSILIDALGLALGGRAEASVVREGQSKAEISACFAIDPALERWLAERDLQGDPGQVLLRRVIDADGRSRALINGHSATAAQLRDIGAQLIEIHGQHAAQSLLRLDGQRTLLDRIGHIDTQALGQAHAAWRSLQTELDAARKGERELALEKERLQWQADELESLAPEPDEWATLQIEQKRLAHAASLIDGCQALSDLLEQADDAVASRLHAAQARLRQLAQIDERLNPTLELIDSAIIQIEEAASTLQTHADRVDLDSGRLADTEERIGALFALARKLRLPPEQLAAERHRLQTALQAIARASDLDQRQQDLDRAARHYAGLAQQISQQRRQVAAGLAQGVNERLARLGMQGASLRIDLQACDPAAHGTDRVEFLICSHAGASARPLAKVASGGELSRVSLALSAVAAQNNPVGTLIFDEADAGVGGAVATVIGQLMRELGGTRQVLCVTHLPQVAACADRHLQVSKSVQNDRTLSQIVDLNRDERIAEIARMLGGAQLTATTRRHAREMLGGA